MIKHFTNITVRLLFATAFVFGFFGIPLSSTKAQAGMDSIPFIQLYLDGSIYARGWPSGTVVTLTIHDPSGSVPDYTDQAAMQQAPWDPDNPDDIEASFNWPPYDLQPGFVVTMEANDIVKTLIIPPLHMTAVDLVADTVTGIATPGTRVHVCAFTGPNSCVLRHTTADSITGIWTVDYSVPGITAEEADTVVLQPGGYGYVYEKDPDGDITSIDWWIRPPVAYAGRPQTVNEGDPVKLDASGSSDPDNDIVKYEWDLDGDGLYDDATGITTVVNFPDEGNFTIGLKVTDAYGLSSTDYVIITVQNVAPVIDTITAPVSPVLVGSSINASAAFHDPGTKDTFTAVWNWGDGTNFPGTVNGHLVGDTHTYTAPGVYTVSLTVTDDDGASTTAAFSDYIVVYDPSGGFVTGGGWIIDPASGSKANFGFNAKYLKGAATPTGDTEFKVNKLNYKSTSYDWLVINGTRAEIQGAGTLDGKGQYGFALTVIDGQATGGHGPDYFRIKIWDKATGAVIYDTQPGAPDSANPTTELGGGSIQIHTK